jgi:uncharacterized membrane protein YkoI
MTPVRKALIGGALAGTALLGGALGASFLGTAGAQTTTDPSTTAPAATASAKPGPHQANGVTETPLTGDEAAKVTAAAQAAVPDATVERVETDADGAAYEAHMTKSDGTRVTVELDSNFAVTATETDSGRGGHGHRGGPHAANGVTETPLTGDDATKATAAAQAAVPGATVDRAETDAEGAAYEVHMTKADGSKVTVKLDSNFNVTETINGVG